MHHSELLVKTMNNVVSRIFQNETLTLFSSLLRGLLRLCELQRPLDGRADGDPRQGQAPGSLEGEPARKRRCSRAGGGRAPAGTRLTAGTQLPFRPCTRDPSRNRAPAARVNPRGIRRACFATFPMAKTKAASPAIKPADKPQPRQRTTDQERGFRNTQLLETGGATPNQWSAAAAEQGRGR